MSSAESTPSSNLTPREVRARRRRRSSEGSWAERSSSPVYEYRYFKDERGRSVQLRRVLNAAFSGGIEAVWELIPSAKSSYTTFDSSRLTYARSAGLPSLGRKYAPGRH